VNWFVYGDVLSRFADLHQDGVRRDALLKGAESYLTKADQVLFDVTKLHLQPQLNTTQEGGGGGVVVNHQTVEEGKLVDSGQDMVIENLQTYEADQFDDYEDDGMDLR